MQAPDLRLQVDRIGYLVLVERHGVRGKGKTRLLQFNWELVEILSNLRDKSSLTPEVTENSAALQMLDRRNYEKWVAKRRDLNLVCTRTLNAFIVQPLHQRGMLQPSNRDDGCASNLQLTDPAG